MALRKYMIINKATLNPCFNGRRFWTIKGAQKKIDRNEYRDWLDVWRIW